MEKIRSSLRSAWGAFVAIVAMAFEFLVWGGNADIRPDGRVASWVIPVLIILIYLTLVLRQRFPLLIFGIQWVFACSALLFISFGPIAGLFVALYTVASRRGAHQAVSCLAVCIAPLAVDSASQAASRTNLESSFLASFFALLGLQFGLLVCVWTLGQLTHRARARSVAELRERDVAAAQALQEERRRVARELHDIIAHAVTAMMLQSSTASILLNSRTEDARVALNGVQDLGLRAMNELHRLLRLLRPEESDHRGHFSEKQPGFEDIRVLVDVARQSGVEVTVRTEGEPAVLDPSVELAAYRVVQECLTNSAKHSPRGGAQLLFKWGENLHVQVSSFPAAEGATLPVVSIPSSGHGLTGLAERVSTIGGRFSSGWKGSVFVVSVDLPVAAASQGSRLFETGSRG